MHPEDGLAGLEKYVVGNELGARGTGDDGLELLRGGLVDNTGGHGLVCRDVHHRDGAGVFELGSF